MRGMGSKRRQGSPRRKRFGLALGAGALVAVTMSLAFAGFAGAVGNLFELDGDATDASSGLPDDWSSITGAIDSVIVNDGTGNGDDIFEGGLSKDREPISTGAGKQRRPTPRRTISHTPTRPPMRTTAS